jgi:hypothetical protein
MVEFIVSRTLHLAGFSATHTTRLGMFVTCHDANLVVQRFIRILFVVYFTTPFQ